MKKILIILIVFLGQLGFAQSDDKFYQPSKMYKEITDLNFENFKIPVENDTITGIKLIPNRKPKANILFFHGTGGNVTSYVFMVRPLVEAGYQVYMIDFRGYGKSTGKPLHGNIAQDGQVFFNYVLNQKKITRKPVLLYGASMGSQIATHLARLNKDKISGLILDGAMSSFGDIASHYAPEQLKEQVKKMKFADYNAKQDILYTGKISKLFIHSKADKNVPYEQGRLLFDNAPQPKTFLEYNGEHLEATKSIRQQVVNAVNSMITHKNSIQ